MELTFQFSSRPVMDQNLYYAGMRYTTATFVSALSNTVPALTFIMAWIFRYQLTHSIQYKLRFL